MGHLARYNVPMYKELHYLVRKEVEKRLGMDLLPTYFYDQILLCRAATESVIAIVLPVKLVSRFRLAPTQITLGRFGLSVLMVAESYVLMKNGDAAVYKGCEREHWRDPLESKYSGANKMWRTFRKKEDDTYHHQIFLHYVNAQGPFVQHANDR